MPHDHGFLPQELIVAVEWTITIEGKNESGEPKPPLLPVA